MILPALIGVAALIALVLVLAWGLSREMRDGKHDA